MVVFFHGKRVVQTDDRVFVGRLDSVLYDVL